MGWRTERFWNVIWDGNTSHSTYHPSFIEVVTGSDEVGKAPHTLSQGSKYSKEEEMREIVAPSSGTTALKPPVGE